MLPRVVVTVWRMPPALSSTYWVPVMAVVHRPSTSSACGCVMPVQPVRVPYWTEPVGMSSDSKEPLTSRFAP